MAENSAIEWTDHTFNPWEGCQKVGPGCDNCYAEARNARFGGGQAINWGPGAPRRRTSPANWRKPLAWDKAHAEFFAQHGRRQRVFCASLADVFDNAVDPTWRTDLFRLIAETPNLDWLLLTKRIGNARAMIAEAAAFVEYHNPGITPWTTAQPWANVWIGATVVNQEELDRYLPKLYAVPAAVRFLSVEPMLGRINLDAWPLFGEAEERLLHWAIAGGESGPNARPMHPDWPRSLHDQCASAGVPFLFKQHGEWCASKDMPDQSGDAIYTEDLSRLRVKSVAIDATGLTSFDANTLGSSPATVYRVGKKAAGRLLDGVQHDGFPAQETTR